MNSEPESIVYIVEDDDAIRDSLLVMLKVFGLNSELFATPKEFLDFQPTTEQSCLIIDARLPGMSGLEMLDKLSPEAKKIPVILITGHGDTSLLEAAKQRGVAECFKKPFRGEELVTAIKNLIASSSSS